MNMFAFALYVMSPLLLAALFGLALCIDAIDAGVLGEVKTFKRGGAVSSRRSNKANEDTFLAGTVRSADVEVRVYAVFDGHGGGEASAYLKNKFLGKLKGLLAESNDLEVTLSLALKQIDNDFLRLHRADAHKMGSCALVLAVTKTHVYSANLGDSFAIMVPNLNEAGQGQTWTPLNELLNAANENERDRILKETYPAGKTPTFDCLQGSCYLIVEGHMLQPTRTIGDKGLHPVVTSTAEIRVFEIPEGGARVVLASDGLWDHLSSETVAEAARQAESPEAAVKTLMQRSFEEAAKVFLVKTSERKSSSKAAAEKNLLRLMSEGEGESRSFIDDTTVLVFDVAAQTPSEKRNREPEF